MSNTIEELQKIVADESRTTEERKHAAELILSMQGQQQDEPWLDIADDDPDLKKHLLDPDSEIAQLFGELAITTLPAAKRRVWEQRKARAQLEVVRDESLPREQRIQAALEWRAALPAKNAWTGMRDSDLLESLSIHPHLAELEELDRFISAKPKLKEDEIDGYITERVQALHEFRRLAAEYPQRKVPVLIAPESNIAFWAKENDPQHGVTRDTYSYALRAAGLKV